MALGSRLWRPVPVDCWEWLEDLSPLAQRTWFWLWTGPTSTPHGVVSVRPYHAAGALKTKPSALLVALSELEQAGRIVMQQGSPSRIDLYLVGYLPAQCPVRPVQRRGIKKGIERVDLGLPTSQALEEWASWDAACRKADDSLDPACAEPEPQQKQKQKQEQKPENKQETNASVAKATDTPAVAVEVRAIANEPDEYDGPDMPDPWAKLQQKYEDPANAERYLPPKEPNITPAAALKLAQSKATQAGIQPAEPPQLAMDLPAGKPQRKELTPGQQDAIFAKRKMLEVVNHWNEVMAGKNAPCVPKTVMPMAGTLMANFAKFQHREPLEDARWLFDWAMAIDPYHSGRQGKPWTLQGWLTADHLSAVFASYRTHKGENKVLTMDIERTLRDWRLAVETAELNNKIAAANNEY
jgi:hypothetical protein